MPLQQPCHRQQAASRPCKRGAAPGQAMAVRLKLPRASGAKNRGTVLLMIAGMSGGVGERLERHHGGPAPLKCCLRPRWLLRGFNQGQRVHGGTRHWCLRPCWVEGGTSRGGGGLWPPRPNLTHVLVRGTVPLLRRTHACLWAEHLQHVLHFANVRYARNKSAKPNNQANRTVCRKNCCGVCEQWGLARCGRTTCGLHRYKGQVQGRRQK